MVYHSSIKCNKFGSIIYADMLIIDVNSSITIPVLDYMGFIRVFYENLQNT